MELRLVSGLQVSRGQAPWSLLAHAAVYRLPSAKHRMGQPPILYSLHLSQDAAACVFGGFAEGFFDADQLVVFGQPVRARQ